MIIADLNEQSFRGISLCFIRNSNNIIITEQNIANVKIFSFCFLFNILFDLSQEVLFHTFECNTEPLLQSLSRSISEIYLPYLQTSETSWGVNNNQMIKIDFLSRLNNFIDTLNSAQESINDRILLKPCENIDLTQIQNAADYISIASNTENLGFIEETMKTWIRQMEQVKKNIQLEELIIFF